MSFTVLYKPKVLECDDYPIPLSPITQEVVETTDLSWQKCFNNATIWPLEVLNNHTQH